jgi:flavin reductase (DIM6/NTAB) family NADH-FMN oxidoreductase RutF
VPFAQYPGGDHIIFVAEVRQMRFRTANRWCSARRLPRLMEKETRA